MVLKLLTLAITFLLAVSAIAGPASVEIPQGRIWHLLETGHVEQAELLEKSIEEFLMTRPIDQVAYLGGGVSTSYLVKFDHNVYAVLKLADPHYPESFRSEVAAYRMDRLLGLNMTPLTVFREVNGLQASLQLYYPGEDISLITEVDKEGRRDNLKVFDYLISNGDREGNTKNTFTAEDGRRIAIDHGRAFLLFTPEQLQTLNYGNPSDEIKNRILSLTQNKVRGKLEGLLSESQIQQVLKRLGELKKNFLKNPPRSVGPAPVGTWPQMRDEFKRPEKVTQYDFWDHFGVWKILRNQNGRRLSPEALAMIQNQSSPAARLNLVRAVYRRWPNFRKEVRREFLNLLWSPEAANLVRQYPEVLRDLPQLDPLKQAQLDHPDQIVSSRPVFSCSKAHVERFER